MTEYRVYYLYDGDELVYIGCSHSLPARLRAHSYEKTFTRYRSRAFKTAKEAFSFEASEIKLHKPKYNKGTANSGRKKLPEHEKMTMVGFYTKQENVDRVGGLQKAREAAKQYIETMETAAPL